MALAWHSSALCSLKRNNNITPFQSTVVRIDAWRDLRCSDTTWAWAMQDRLLDILSQLVSCNRFLIIRFSVLPLFDRVITCLSFFSLLTDFFFALFMPSNVFSNCPLLITHLDCVLLSWSLLGNSLEFFIFIYLPVNCSSFADLIKVDSLIIQQLITFRGT